MAKTATTKTGNGNVSEHSATPPGADTDESPDDSPNGQLLPLTGTIPGAIATIEAVPRQTEE